LILPFLHYILRAKDEHSLHSPFVFSLYTKAIKPNGIDKRGLSEVEALRNKLFRSTETITVTDYGAGSRVSRSPVRKLSSIAKNAEKPKKLATLLFRLVQYFKPKTVVELGTSLGLTTAYLAKAQPSASVVTFEGCPQTAKVAQQHFDELGLTNIDIALGNIDQTLPQRLATIPTNLDFVFFDANHRYEPTVRYFETCLEYAHEDSLFVFDDIHWSPEMEKAWKYIQAHASVTITIDLFYVGLVFFRTKQPKQDFVLKL
jgi:predicted O-methyltransferase YrrM